MDIIKLLKIHSNYEEKNKIIKKMCISIFLTLFIFATVIINSTFIGVYAATENQYCSTITPQITESVYNYLNEIYIKKYPSLGKEFSFGTDADKAVLNKFVNIVTKGIKTDKEKCLAISNWIKDNIQYYSYGSNEASYYAIDVFYTRKANCLGYAHLLSQLCRLTGIPAVMCGGTRGDMEQYITLDRVEEDHEWVMVYYDNNWHLFDPLFNTVDINDKGFISKWYFFADIEGITPYVKGYEKYFHNGHNTFYINNKFVNYVNDIPASKYYNGAAEGGLSYNNSMPFFTKNKYLGNDGTHDGFKYIQNPQRRDTMINDECYTNGWIGYFTDNEPEEYAKPNGVLAQCTIKTYNNKTYYLPYGQSSFLISGKSTDYTLTNGLMTLKTGKTLYMKPTWYQSQIDDGKIIQWESKTPETASVDKNGNITGLKEGYACIDVYSRDKEDNNVTYAYESIELIIASKDRVPNYKTQLISDKCKIKGIKNKTFTGNKITQNITVNHNYKKLKKNVDYTITYKNNKKVGTATIIISFKGNYGGQIIKTFKILPKETTIKKISAKKKGFKIKLKKQASQTTGYQIQYATNNKFTSNKKTLTISPNSEISKTIKKLKSKKKYFVRVRTYKIVDGKKYYSSWSDVKTIKTK